MKFLVLFLLIACGSNTPNPDSYLSDAVDSEIDSVGLKSDQRFKTFNPMSVTLKIKESSYVVSNNFDYEHAVKKLLVSAPTLNTRDFFSEWAFLRLPNKNTFGRDSSEPFTDIELSFDSPTIKPYSLSFVSEAANRFLGPWSQKMNVQLTRDEVTALATGTGFIKMNKLPLEELFLENLKNSTVRIILRDRVIYASKETSVENILKANGIDRYKDLSKSTPYLINPTENPDYWLRKTGPNEYAAGKFSSRDLKETFLNMARPLPAKILKRHDGSLMKDRLQVLQNNTAYFQVSPRQVVRNFSSQKGYSSYGSFGREGVSRNCDYYRTSHVSDSTLENIGLEELKAAIVIDSSHPLEDLTFTEINDHHGKYWEVYFRTDAEDYEVSIQDPKPVQTVEVGISSSYCPDIPNGTQTYRVEESLSLSLTSFNSFTR